MAGWSFVRHTLNYGDFFTQPERVFEKETHKSAAEPNGNTNARKRKQPHYMLLTQGAEYNRGQR
jgi:hypothetical protein